MLHEIIDTDENITEENKNDTHDDLIKPNQRLEVIKISGCKMKAKDILEIGIGLKTIQDKDKKFSDRVFILRFLNKLEADLPCKARVIISGNDFDQIKMNY